MTIHAVLLIPTPGHERLLEEGAGGSRPPEAWFSSRTERWHEATAWTRRQWCGKYSGISPPPSKRRGLALAWEREILDDGLVRLGGDMGELGVAISYALTGIDNGVSIIEATEEWGTIVLLDEHGKEVVL